MRNSHSNSNTILNLFATLRCKHLTLFCREKLLSVIILDTFTSLAWNFQKLCVSPQALNFVLISYKSTFDHKGDHEKLAEVLRWICLVNVRYAAFSRRCVGEYGDDQRYRALCTSEEIAARELTICTLPTRLTSPCTVKHYQILNLAQILCIVVIHTIIFMYSTYIN